MIYETNNMFYISNFNTIGGVETYIFELARKYHDIDITVVYRTGSKEQVNRVKQYVRVIKHVPGNTYKTNKIFCNYETDILDVTEKKKAYQLVHAMFKTQRIKPVIDDRIDEWLAVSEGAQKEWYELTGIKPKLIRNPLQITAEEKNPCLWLISATRLTKEKGKDRMIKLAEELDKAGINYIWLIFTNDTEAIDNPNVVYMEPKLNIRPYIASIKGKGYGVQLSDCEGDCYFTRECMGLGVPTILTPVLSFKEQGWEEGKNCYYVPFDMNDIKLDRFKKIPKVEPYIKEDKWNELLVDVKSKYSNTTKYYEVEALDTYKKNGIVDKTINRIPEPGEKFVVDDERLQVLLGDNYGNRKYVEVIKQVKQNTKK